MEDKLDQAREIARKFIKDNKKLLEIDGRELKRYELKALCGLEELPEELQEQDDWPLIENLNDLDFYEQGSTLYDPDDVCWLIREAETDPVAYQACLDLIIYCLQEDIPIDGFHKFLLNHLKKHSNIPTCKGPKKHSHFLRNILIAKAVLEVSKKTGIPSSRNQSPTGIKTSACDIVAEELPKEFNLSFEGVKKIWINQKRNLRLWRSDTYIKFFE